MEKLVLSYSSGDGCTYSCDNNLPFYAESKIAAELELFALWEEVDKKLAEPEGRASAYFNFHNHELSFWDFADYDKEAGTNSYMEPEIMTLDEWFNRYCEEKLVDAAQN